MTPVQSAGATLALVRDHVGVNAWCEASQKIMGDACREAARTRDDLPTSSISPLRTWCANATSCRRSIPSCVQREPTDFCLWRNIASVEAGC
jgi:hypothetical protein